VWLLTAVVLDEVPTEATVVAVGNSTLVALDEEYVAEGEVSEKIVLAGLRGGCGSHHGLHLDDVL